MQDPLLSCFLEFFIIKPISSLFLCSCVMDESICPCFYIVFGPLFSVDMASIMSFERMLASHVGQLSWSFLSQVGPCHQNSFPFSILTVQLLVAISAVFWGVDTYRNSMPLLDWISYILLWTNGVRIFFDFNHQCNTHFESVHKVFRWILSCKLCVMKLMLLVPKRAACSLSLGNDVSFSGAILDLLNIRLVIVWPFSWHRR